MKKWICAVLLLLAGTTGIFGREFSLSAGAGGLLGGVFTRYTLVANGVIQETPIKINSAQEMNQFNYGFFAFLDATYGVFSVFYQHGTNTYKETADISVLSNNVNQSGRGWETMLGFSVLGKYPFRLNDTFTIFPLLGAEYQISLRQRRTQADGWIYDRTDGLRERDKDRNAYRLSDWNAFWINVGAGLDFELPRSFFLRGELLYGFRLMTSYERKNVDMMRSQSGDSSPSLGGLTSGPSIRISAGYRFFTRQW